MIPVLYEENATSFLTNGQGRLSDVISCIVTEERNGAYELEIEYPINGIHFGKIKHSSIIKVLPSDGADLQLFRVYKITKPLNGICKIYAEHISYQLSLIPCMPFSASNVAETLNKLSENATESCPFSFWTDKTTVASYNQDIPASIRSRLGGVQGSVLDVYGGEFLWDNYTVRLYANRGQDNGVVLRYGKNITDIEQEENIENTITGVCPFYKKEDTIITLPEKVLHSQYAPNYPFQRTVALDLSSAFQDIPTVTQLRNEATSYMSRNKIGIPKVSIKVSFIPLWQTEEYKNIAPLERVKLCDTVTIKFEKLNINAKAKIVKTVFDVLNERYQSIEVGEATSNLTQKILDQTNNIQGELNNTASFLEDAILNATEQITGQKGGYVVTNRDANGQPYEILIMDTPDINTAKKVWRWNNAGLGFSSKGYAGPYGTAITQDGQIVADYIKTGSLKAINISGVNISGSSISGTNISGGIIELKDPPDRAYAVLTAESNDLPIKSNFAGYGVSITSNNSALVSINSGRYLDGTYYGVISLSSSDTIESFFSAWRDQTFIKGNLVVNGTKSRIADTENYAERLLYCYEMPEPIFGDLGTAEIDETGLCYVEIDDIFNETVVDKYVVFLQGENVRVKEKGATYFIVEGKPNTSFDWEIKAKQKGFEEKRLEINTENYDLDVPDLMGEGLEEYENYIKEQEEIL